MTKEPLYIKDPVTNKISLPDATKRLVLEWFASGCTNREVHGMLGISATTWTQLKQQSPEFNAEIEASRQRWNWLIREGLKKKVTEGDTKVLLHLSKSKLRAYESRPNDNMSFNLDVSSLSDQELEEQVRRILQMKEQTDEQDS